MRLSFLLKAENLIPFPPKFVFCPIKPVGKLGRRSIKVESRSQTLLGKAPKTQKYLNFFYQTHYSAINK